MPHRAAMTGALLVQALEESRYHRRFHHTIFVLAVTLYSGLLVIQLSNSVTVAEGFPRYFVIIGVGVIIPLYFIYLIFSYHETISKINSIIYELAAPMLDTARQGCDRLRMDLLNALLFKKYADAIQDGRNLKFVGRGHWFFSGVVVLLVTMNAAVFFR